MFVILLYHLADVVPGVILGWSGALIALVVYFLIGGLTAAGLCVVSQEAETLLESPLEVLHDDWIVHALCPAQSSCHFCFLSGGRLLLCGLVIIGEVLALAWFEGLAHGSSPVVLSLLIIRAMPQHRSRTHKSMAGQRGS